MIKIRAGFPGKAKEGCGYGGFTVACLPPEVTVAAVESR